MIVLEDKFDSVVIDWGVPECDRGAFFVCNIEHRMLNVEDFRLQRYLPFRINVLSTCRKD